MTPPESTLTTLTAAVDHLATTLDGVLRQHGQELRALAGPEYRTLMDAQRALAWCQGVLAVAMEEELDIAARERVLRAYPELAHDRRPHDA